LHEEVALPRLSKSSSPQAEKLVGSRIRSLRKLRGLSQAEIGEQLGIHQSLVSEYERGTVRVPGTVVVGLARILRTSADNILGLKASKQDGAFADRRLIRRLERIEKLPRRAKQALLKTIDTYLIGSERPR
jgi:transcriptional regulator with XRE-family HTH domain